MDVKKKKQIEKMNQVKDFMKKEYPNRKLLLASFFGSQKYKIQTETSDYDICTFINPTFDDLYENKMIKTDAKVDNIDVKIYDIRKIIEFIIKSNTLSFEILLIQDVDYFSKEGQDIKKVILENNRKWSDERKDKLHFVMTGMMIEKIKAIEKDLPSEKTNEGYKRKIKFGFDTKQLLHIRRLSNISKKILNGENPLDCLVVSEKEKIELLDIKNNKSNTTKEEALKIGKETLKQQKEILDKITLKPIEKPIELENVIKKTIKDSLHNNGTKEVRII